MQYLWYKLNGMKKPMAISMLRLRHQVFAVEGGRRDLGNDVIDIRSDHLCVVDEQQVIGCLRLYPLLEDPDCNRFTIGRFCVAEEFRKKEIGRKMLSMALIKGVMRKGLNSEFEIEAQLYLAGLYQSLGFQPSGDIYEEENIPFVKMCLTNPIAQDLFAQSKGAR